MIAQFHTNIRGAFVTLLLLVACLFPPFEVCGQSVGVEFEDASEKLDFVHRGLEFGGNGLAGAAWFDYDNDGLLDLFLPNGKTQANALFRNLGDGSFQDVAASAGLEADSGSAGVIAADFDNDGWKDILLTGDGGLLQGTAQAPLLLYRNVGDGTFEDVTNSSGITGPRTQLSAAVADIDADSYLDIFIAGSGSIAENRNDPNGMYRNNGDFTFTDISESSGVNTSLGACAALFSDFDHDRDQDLIVANCNDRLARFTPLELFRNNGDLTFTDVAEEAGVSRKGLWMGICGSDYDRDGDTDLFVTNIGNGHAFFESQGDGSFVDRTLDVGILPYPFGWGCAFSDFDNDGYHDLFWTGSLVGICPPRAPAAPGSSCRTVSWVGEGIGNPGTLLFNDAGSGFSPRETAALPVNLEELFTSGVAHGDFDADGFEDVAVMTDRVPPQLGSPARSGRPILLRNQGNGNGWIRVKLVGSTSNRDGVGSRVIAFTGGEIQSKEVVAGSSMLSQNSQWLTFGLGSGSVVDSVHVTWPTGKTEAFSSVNNHETAVLIEGSGRAVTVGLSEIPSAHLPASSLSNYPNPLISSTRIEYSLEESTTVTISVVDVTGRMVRRLSDARESSGRHTLTWDRRDDRGGRVSAGVYGLILSTVGQRQTRALVVVE